ncbi:MAG: hypothetical protein ABS949_17215 [Solibacillus sp.]
MVVCYFDELNLTRLFIAEFKKPALTIKISPSVGDMVVPLSNWPRIWAQQKYVGLLAAKEI